MGNKRQAKSSNTVKLTVDRLSQPNPRMNLRGRLNENVSFVTGNEYNGNVEVASAATVGFGSVLFAPGNTAGRSNAAVNAVGRFFQKGLYLPGSFVKYIPSVGLNTAGNIIIGWVDSPDLVRAWLSLAPGAHLNFVRDLNNSKTSPVWQELTFPLTQPPRRKTFMVDPAIDINIDSIDQSVQGYFVYVVYGVDAPVGSAKTFGQLMIHCKERFEEVKSFVTPQ